MDIPQDFATDSHTYVIYRDVAPGEPCDPTSPLAFFPPKDSDELFDALRLAFPHLKTHSERMRDAIIQFLLEERLGEQSEPSPAMTMEASTASWPSVSTGSASSTFTSPELANFATPSSFANSPQLQSAPLTRQVSSTASNTPPSLDQMTGVFSLSTSAQTKQRTRRKMTEAEKLDYQKRRIVKACDKCSKRKRKCTHNETEMQTLTTPTAKVTKAAMKSAKATKTITSQHQQLFPSHDNNFALDDTSFTSGSTFTGGTTFNMFEDPLPELTLDDFIHFEHFQQDYNSNPQSWADFTLLDPVNDNTRSREQATHIRGPADARLLQPSRAATTQFPQAMVPSSEDNMSMLPSQDFRGQPDSHDHGIAIHDSRALSTNLKAAQSMSGHTGDSFAMPYDEEQYVPRPRRPTSSAQPTAAATSPAASKIETAENSAYAPASLSAMNSSQPHGYKSGHLLRGNGKESALRDMDFSEPGHHVRSRAEAECRDTQTCPESSSSRLELAPTSISVSTHSDALARGIAAPQGRPLFHTLPKDQERHAQNSNHVSSSQHSQRDTLPTSKIPTLGEGVPENVNLSTELFRLRRKISTHPQQHAARRATPGSSEAIANPLLQTRASLTAAPLSSRAGGIPSHAMANDHADVRLASTDTRTAHARTSSSTIASLAGSDVPHTDRLSDHVRYRDHHGRTSPAQGNVLDHQDSSGNSGRTPSQTWVLAAATVAVLFFASTFLPTISLSMGMLALLQPASSFTLSFSQPQDETEDPSSMWNRFAKCNWTSARVIDLDRALKTQQHLRGSGESSGPGALHAGAQGWLAGLMYPFELAPMRFAIV